MRPRHVLPVAALAGLLAASGLAGASGATYAAQTESDGTLFAFTAQAITGRHAGYVSNSWGAAEFSGESAYDGHFRQPGVSYFVSSGDAGLPAEWPSSSPSVVSVGGTTLNFSSGVFTSETGWSESGGGCSLYEAAAPAQSAFGQYAQVACESVRWVQPSFTPVMAVPGGRSFVPSSPAFQTLQA